MADDLSALGERIRELREARSYSIGKVAKRAGISSAYWHAVENATPTGRTGRASLPSVPVLRSMADALDADRAEVLELAGYDEDAAFDRARNARMNGHADAALGGKVGRLAEEDRRYIEDLVDRLLGEEA